ncbi:hypothetical protein [Streptomyces sp. NPDC046197]|uniref:hypothetical protein n=1 Tax=Streptomyces sp. NPDC046197 TaxID=3154337 RepID=UPI00340EC5EB
MAGPTSCAVQREVEAAFSRVREVANGVNPQDPAEAADEPLRAQDLSEDELRDLRTTAQGELL